MEPEVLSFFRHFNKLIYSLQGPDSMFSLFWEQKSRLGRALIFLGLFSPSLQKKVPVKRPI
jgi:hypothetical protein